MLTNEQATERVRRLRKMGVIPPWGRDRNGRTSAFFFSFAQVAIAAVLFELMDRAAIHDAARLREIYDCLAADREGAGSPLIDRLLADVESGGEPRLIVMLWARPDGAAHTTFSPRLTCEADDLPELGGDWRPILEGRLALAPILARFCDADVEADAAKARVN
jgi:hypothetical protein